jgi:hypothetical protein
VGRRGDPHFDAGHSGLVHSWNSGRIGEVCGRHTDCSTAAERRGDDRNFDSDDRFFSSVAVASVITIAFVIGDGSSSPDSLFVATVEVICLLIMIWIAWT